MIGKFLLLCGFVFLLVVQGECTTESNPFLSFTVKDIKGKDFSLSDVFENSKLVIFVNVASWCGYTKSTYSQLQKLYEKYQDEGLMVIGFPCNQFGGQEPAPEAEILSHVQSEYGITFPLMSKIEVNGPNANPLYKTLKCQTGCCDCDIKWNFEKFLVTNSGEVRRVSYDVSIEQYEKGIQRLLQF